MTDRLTEDELYEMTRGFLTENLRDTLDENQPTRSPEWMHANRSRDEWSALEHIQAAKAELQGLYGKLQSKLLRSRLQQADDILSDIHDQLEMQQQAGV